MLLYEVSEVPSPIALPTLSPLFRNPIYPTHFQQQTMRSSSSFGLASTVVAISLLACTAVVNAACSTRGNVITTFYGYPDNDPPGPATAYNCGGRNNIAGGEYIYIFFYQFYSPPFFAQERLSPLLPPKKKKKEKR